MPKLDDQMDIILGKLEIALDTVNSGGESDLRLADSEWDTINAARDAMAGTRLELTESEIERADTRARLFEKEIGGWDRAELRRRMLAAKEAGDRVTCYLIGTYAPDAETRLEAMRVPGSMDLREQVSRANRLFGELNAAKQVPAESRAKSAYIQGKQVVKRAIADAIRAADTERANAAKSAMRTELPL